MRRAILSVVFVGLTATLAAQTVGSTIRGSAGSTISGGRRISYQTIAMTGKSTKMTGLVMKLQDGTKVSADEAVLDKETQVIEMSGHVKMTFAK